MKILTTSVDTTLSIEDDVVLVDASGGDVTIHLPLTSKDKSFRIKKIDASTNDVIIDTGVQEK